MIVKNSQPLIRFLFLGNPDHDRRLQNFSDYFRSKGWEVELLCGISAHDTPTLKATYIPLSKSKGPFRFLEYHRALQSKVRSSRRADITMACDLYSLKAAAATKPDKTILIYDARELYTKLPSVEGKLSSKVWKKIEAAALLKTDLVVMTGDRDVDALLQVHSFLPKTAIVRNIPSQNCNPAPKDLRNHFSIPPSKKIMVYLGGLQQDRGLEAILNVMPKLPSDVVFVLIGGGILKNKLERIASEQNLENKVFFYGNAASEEAMGLLCSADIGISLIEQNSGSYKLALPSKVFEYLYAGLPVVSSELVAVKDIAVNTKNIFFADEHSEYSIVEAINQAIKYSTAVNSKEIISTESKARYSFENDAEKLFTVLERIAR